MIRIVLLLTQLLSNDYKSFEVVNADFPQFQGIEIMAVRESFGHWKTAREYEIEGAKDLLVFKRRQLKKVKSK